MFGSVKDNEANKFRDAGVSGTKVAVTIEQDGGSAALSVSPAGLRIRLKVTNMTISDVASKIPAVPLADRNSIIIQNRDSGEIIFLGESDVQASGVLEGWELSPTSFFSTDITEDIEVYGIAPAGKTVNLKIMELA